MIAGARNSATKVFLLLFDNLLRELFDAPEIDGGGAYHIYWSNVLPMSRPIGVVSPLTIISAWKEFLWPPRVHLVIVPVLQFLVFQRQFLRGAGQAGAPTE